MIRALIATALALVLATPATAERSTTLAFGLGHSRITADELVYDESDLVSRLTWSSHVPVAQFGLRQELPQGWVLDGQFVTGLGADGFMADYDWLRPWATGTGPDDWSHRSLHSATDLKRYVDLDVTLGRQIATLGRTQIGLHAGLKYTEVSWRARGGSFVYSRDGFRNAIFSQPDSRRAVDYTQRHKAVFAGAEVLHQAGAWNFAGLLRAGLSVQPREVDLHWQRHLRFDHTIDSQPYVSLGLSGSYALRENLTLGVEASWQRFFERRGDARISDMRDGELYLNDPDSISGELTTAN
ncbi:MAG: omptin family outer membrane protease, partial [Paracoccus sp. (in: a-proteobacteria)]